MSNEFKVEKRELELKIYFTHAASSYDEFKEAAGRLKEFLQNDVLLSKGDSYLLVSEGDGCGD